VHAPRWPANHRAAIRPPPEFAAAPPQSARAPLPYRRCTDEYGGIEYGGLPVNYRILQQMNQSLLRPLSALLKGIHLVVQSLCGSGLVGRSPLSGELGRVSSLWAMWDLLALGVATTVLDDHAGFRLRVEATAGLTGETGGREQTLSRADGSHHHRRNAPR
jgi:hypothetical protein